MAANPTKKSVRADVNTFVQGFITEASPLNFPANASVAEENFELNKDGTRDRRRGLDFEVNHGFILTNAKGLAYDSFGKGAYVWKNVGGDSNKEFIVLQVNNWIFFYNSQLQNISRDGYVGVIAIPAFDGSKRLSFASVDGYLIIAGGVRNIAVISCNAANEILAEYQYIRVRDVWGVQVPPGSPDTAYDFQVDYRGTINTPDQQIYNLQNQGWGITRRGGNFDSTSSSLGFPTTPVTIAYDYDNSEFVGGTPPPSTVPVNAFITSPRIWDPAAFFRNALGRYPSNSESVFSGMAYAPTVTGQPPSEQMMPNIYDEVRGSTQPTAKGYFIIDALNRGQSRTIESYNNKQNYPWLERYMTSTVPDLTTGGATIVQEYAGRIFYAGFDGTVIGADSKSPNLENCIMFSQIVRNKQDLTRCFQEGDPTSRDGSDIVDTDGGFIKLSDAGKILSLKVFGQSLVVFCDNGVWMISGGSEYGFTASNYKATKMSSVGVVSPLSIVSEVDRIFYWALDGIYMLGTDQLQTTGVKNITERSIQTFYQQLPSNAKANAFGTYDTFTKKMKWMYNAGVGFTDESETFELVLDSVIGSFSLHRIGRLPSRSVEVFGMVVSEPFFTGNVDVDVDAGDDDVLAGTDSVLVSRSSRVSGLQSVRYPTLYTDPVGDVYVTLSTYNNTQFRDWYKLDNVGIDAKAFFITGHQTAGDSAIDKQVPYLVVHFKRTENGVNLDGTIANQSGCLMRGQWDFSNTINSKKWGPLFQAYRYTDPRLIVNADYDNGFEVLTTKNKLRGRGRAFALYAETQPFKDCRIVGWNLSVNGNAVA